MAYQKDIFGESDGKVDRVLSFITKRQYEGATPTDISQSLRHRVGRIKEILSVLAAGKQIIMCGQREATLRSKRLESVYKATRYATQAKPVRAEKQKALADTEHVKLVERVYSHARKAKCPACGIDVVIQETEYGDEYFDPQKRYVIFDTDDGELSGFDIESGRYVAGRAASNNEARVIYTKKQCGKSWAIMRSAHCITCTSGAVG